MAKLTESLLRKIVKEELKRVLNEGSGDVHGTIAVIIKRLEKNGLKNDADRLRERFKDKDLNTYEVKLYKQGDGKLALETYKDLEGNYVQYSQLLDVLSAEAAQAVGL